MQPSPAVDFLFIKTTTLPLAAWLLLSTTILPASAGNDLTITTGTNANVTAGPNFLTTNDRALLTPASITALWSLGNVSIGTGTGGANSQPGNITIERSIDTTTTFDLLVHGLGIQIDAGISSNGAGGITLEGGDFIWGAENSAVLSTVGGAIALDAGAWIAVAQTVTTEGGAVSMRSSGAGIEVSFVNANGGSAGDAGTITLHAAGVGATGIVAEALVAGSNVGMGGTVTLTSAGSAGITVGSIETGTGALGATGGAVSVTGLGLFSGVSGSAGSAGDITVEASGAITVGATSAIGADSSGGNGGAVSLHSSGAGISVNGSITTTGTLSSGNITLNAPSVSVANLITGGSAVRIFGQQVTLGDLHADGTIDIAPQVGQTSMSLEITGMWSGIYELTLNFGSAGSFEVAPGATLGGSGTIGGNTTILGTLAPGNSPGTLTFTGDLDLTAAESLVFELGLPASDHVLLTLGTLSIDALGLDDFQFSNAGGFAPGDYLLFDTSAAILGFLDPAQMTGTVLGFDAVLGFTDGGQDITLHVAPEPGSALLLATGGALLLNRRRAGARPA